jgi:lipopolysaccharide export system permease protein
MTANLRMTHNDIIQLKRSPDEMNFDEKRAYIDILGKGGKDIRRQLIEYYGDYAFPFANFIVVLFGVPFASIKKKGGIAIQIGAAMIVSFLYLIFTKVGQTVGYNSNMDPVLSAWLANLLFLLAGIVNLLRTKT